MDDYELYSEARIAIEYSLYLSMNVRIARISRIASSLNSTIERFCFALVFVLFLGPISLQAQENAALDGKWMVTSFKLSERSKKAIKKYMRSEATYYKLIDDSKQDYVLYDFNLDFKNGLIDYTNSCQKFTKCLSFEILDKETMLFNKYEHGCMVTANGCSRFSKILMFDKLMENLEGPVDYNFIKEEYLSLNFKGNWLSLKRVNFLSE